MWYKIDEKLPPKDIVINTKISDNNGERNEQKLIFDGKMWWNKDKTMYIYYVPTHWKYDIYSNIYSNNNR